MVGRTPLPNWDVTIGPGMAGPLHGLGGPVIELMGILGMYNIQAARTYLGVHLELDWPFWNWTLLSIK